MGCYSGVITLVHTHVRGDLHSYLRRNGVSLLACLLKMFQIAASMLELHRDNNISSIVKNYL